MLKVVKYTTFWCSACKVYDPIFEEVKKELPMIKFESKDAEDEDPNYLIELGVKAVPTTLIFRDDKLEKMISGVIPKKDLVSYLT